MAIVTERSLILFALVDTLYATPRHVESPTDCCFYHVMEIPGHGQTQDAQWDLRGNEEAYLGNVDISGKRVLELGPASGYMSFYMESRGAEVVSVELSPEMEWDVVPDAQLDVENFVSARRQIMEKLRNSYWFAHERVGSKARVHYGSGYAIPKELGHFDVATLCAVLLHVRDPLRVLANCADLADTLIVSDLVHPDVPANLPVMSWYSTPEAPSLDCWWKFSPQLFVRFGEVLGFSSNVVTYHQQMWTMDGPPRPAEMYTVVSSQRRSSRSAE